MMSGAPRRQRGFTYLGLLAAIIILGLMLTIVARVWHTVGQREKEAQLLWVGHAYRLAISSYYAFGHRYPVALQDLLLDDRFPMPKRHLRQLYPDPMTGKADWTLVLTPSQGGIQGVASSSKDSPIKRDGFDLPDALFKDSDCYCQWQFTFYPRGLAGGGALWGSPSTAPPPPEQSPGMTPGTPTTAPGVPLPLPNLNGPPSGPPNLTPGKGGGH